MHSQMTLVGVSLAAMMGAGCTSRDRAFTDADAAAIRGASAAYAKAETAGDFEKWFAFSTTDAVYMPEQSRTLQGRDTLAQWFAQIPRGATLDTTSQEITGHGDVAVERGSYVGAM